ncbi:MAG: hypothetical protein ACLUYV_04465 [Alistipes shahii]
MENKLQQLTQKLYDEGLEKRARRGRQAGGRRHGQRAGRSSPRPAPRPKRSSKGGGQGRGRFEEHHDRDFAGRQAGRRQNQVEIASLIIAKATARGVKEAVVDPAFIKEMLVAVAKNWNGSDSGKVELQALLPEGERAEARRGVRGECGRSCLAGVEVGWSKEVKTGFKVGAKEGGYYISFADADIEALLAEYLRDKVFQLLFKA